MSEIINKKDEVVMKLVHYFVTEEDYQPIIVNGVKNEIWLENLEAPYKVVRINSNYIHNEEQLKFDIFKIRNITRQIKKKTFSLKMKTLNILLDINGNVDIKNSKDVDNFRVDSIKDVRSDNNLAGLFPKLKTMTLNGNDFDMIMNITNDISEKNAEESKEYEQVFKPKKIIVTNVLIALNIIMFIICLMQNSLFDSLYLSPSLVKNGEYYRLFTCAFLHANLVHLLTNVYALKLIGTQVETFLGKGKFLIIYFFSMITSSLLVSVGQVGAVGASGAIFGLLGCLLYFGYYYRLYLGTVLLSQVVPVIVLNLVLYPSLPIIFSSVPSLVLATMLDVINCLASFIVFIVAAAPSTKPIILVLLLIFLLDSLSLFSITIPFKRALLYQN